MFNQSVFLKDGTGFDNHRADFPLFSLPLCVLHRYRMDVHVCICLYIYVSFMYTEKYVCVYMHICICIYACTNMCAYPEAILFKYSYTTLIRWESVFFLSTMFFSESLIPILKLDCKHLYLLNHAHQSHDLGTEMIFWRQSNFDDDLQICNYINFLPTPLLLDNRSYTLSSHSLPPISKCLKGKLKNKQMKNAALLHIYTLVVLFCFVFLEEITGN